MEYLSGNRIQGSSTLTSSPPQTSWKEIGRFKLSSASSAITVKGLSNATSGTLADKDNIMILGHTINSGNTNVFFRCNGDNQQKYAENGQINGGTNYTQDDQTQLDLSGGAESKPMFIVQNIVNVPAQEKLIISNTNNCATGAGNTPNRIELVGKWESPSNTAIQSVSFNNTSTGDYATDSEIVVLGCDNNEADSGTNFWQELSSTVLTATHSGALTIPQFATKKYLMIKYYINASTDCFWKVGTGGSIDSGNNYHNRYNSNGGGDSTLQYTSFLQHNPIVNGTVFIINKSDKEKLMIQHEVGQNQGTGSGGSGVGNAPNRREDVGKWANTSGQIDTLQYDKSGVSFYAGTTIKVYGAD